ncbi:MAG: SH3 domain-containing protein [Bdellovibrionales bacterium]
MLRLRITTFWIACALWASAFPATAESASPADLFQKGLSAYQNQHYAEARDIFQSLATDLESRGQINPRILHNLALTYYKLNQKPLALALWRKALSADANYPPARLGRELLETSLNSRPWEGSGTRHWIHRVLERVSLYELLWILAAALMIAGGLWIKYFAGRRDALEEERPLPAFPTGAILAGLFVLGSLALVAFKLADVLVARGTIIETQARVRSLPADEGVPLFEISGGTEVQVRRHSGKWIQVQNAEGATGWVRGSEILVTSEW